MPGALLLTRLIARAHRPSPYCQLRTHLSQPQQAALETLLIVLVGRGKRAAPAFVYLQKVTQPVLVANGSNDWMMVSVNSYTSYQHLANAHLIMCPDSNQVFLFQYSEQFSEQVNRVFRPR